MRPISLGYKQEKARLVLELWESTNQLVKCTDVSVRTDRKWKVQTEVNRAISILQHREVMISAVWVHRTGLGGTATVLVQSHQEAAKGDGGG